MKHNNGFAVHKLALSSHSYDFIVCDSAREIHFLSSLCVCACVCHNSVPNYKKAQ